MGALLASGDLAVALIVVQRGLVKPAALDAHVEAFVARGAARSSASLLSHLVDKGVVSQGDVPAIKQARAAMGCACAACGEVTYLLPGQTHDATPCERCKKGPLGLPGAQPARRSAVQAALPPARASSAVQAALPPAASVAPAAVGTRVEPAPPPAAAPEDQHRKVLAGVGVILLLCFLAPCLVFALTPAPDYSEYLAAPKGGKYRAEVTHVIGTIAEGLVMTLQGRGQTDTPLVRSREQLDPRAVIVPYRLFVSDGAELEARFAQLRRDRESMRMPPLSPSEAMAVVKESKGEILLPWVFELIRQEPTTTPVPVVVRVVVYSRNGEVGVPKVTELAVDR
jgi:hypothetical protein